MALGPEAMEHGCALLCWRVFTLTEDDTSRPFLALGILLLEVATPPGRADGVVFREVCRWVRMEETRALAWLQEHAPGHMVAMVDDLNVLDLTPDDRYDAAWKQMVTRVLLAPPLTHPAEAVNVLQELGRRLTQDEGKGRHMPVIAVPM